MLLLGIKVFSEVWVFQNFLLSYFILMQSFLLSFTYLHVVPFAVMIAMAEALCDLVFDYYFYQHSNVKECQGEAKEGQWRLEGGVEIWGEWILKSATRPQVASLSSPCSDFISSLGATTAGNIWVLSYKRPTSLLFSWELKDRQSCAEMRGYLYECI